MYSSIGTYNCTDTADLFSSDMFPCRFTGSIKVANQSLMSHVAILHQLATQRGFTLRNVIGGGHCGFAAVAFGLSHLGIETTHQELRRNVCDYLRQNPYTADGVHYKDFLQLSASSNAGTEWESFLKDLSAHEWADEIVMQALADMLSVNIDVLTTIGADKRPVSHYACQNQPVGTVNIGLIEEYHYVALERLQTTSHQDDQSSQERTCVNNTDNEALSNETSLSANELHHCQSANEAHQSTEIPSDADQQCNQLDQQDEVQRELVQIRGLPYESGLQKEEVESSADKIYSVAPGEGQTPMNMFTDEHFEEMSNPTKYPYGKGGMNLHRERNITIRKYFNQRLLHVDGRFAKDIEYLLAAQYAVEHKQVSDEISIAMRQTQGQQYRGQALTAGHLKNSDVVQQMIRSDDAYKFLKNVRGSPAYFQRVMYEVLAMIRQLGLPTWFLTLSAADMQWPDVIQTIAHQYGTILSDDDVLNMSFEDKSKWLRQNPVTAARHFHYRLQNFFNIFLKSSAHPVGELVDYAIRIEFQARGSPHAHTILWIKNSPKLGLDPDQEVCSFIDRYVWCCIPEDDHNLANMVQKVQRHKHSATCRRNGQCRFHYPRPPSPHTLIAHETNQCSPEEWTEAQQALNAVHKMLNSNEIGDDSTLEDVLAKANVSMTAYVRGLSICSSGNAVIMQRQVSETWINTYNPDVLRTWRANMDIQFILDPYACVMYIASYMLKSERSMGELLKQVSKESNDLVIRAQLRRLGSVFLNHREVSAQEAVYRILSLPLKQLSRKVVFVNTNFKKDRVGIFKKDVVLQEVDDDDEHVYQTSLIDRYAARPSVLDDMCLAEFAANYSTMSGNEEEQPSDVLPSNEPEDNQPLGSRKIKLNNKLGNMYKRRREAVIRLHKFNITKEPEKVYHSKLMLYLPWRNEETDILGRYMSFKARYDDLSDDIRTNELRYSQNACIIDEAYSQLQQQGPPQHAWDQIAPGAEDQQAQDQMQGMEDLTTMEQEDLDANTELFQRRRTAPLLQRFTTENTQQLMSPDEYRQKMRQLNTKQRQIVDYHRRWCKNVVLSFQTNQPSLARPYRLFLSGPGGVGKSHVISVIHHDTVKLLRLSRQFEPDDVLVLLTAPTGIAAMNINGMTIHSALLLGISKTSFHALSREKLNTLRLKLSRLKLLIVDEISMVGSNLLLQIHKRLQQITGSTDNTTFGNISILAVGDFYQLQPVGESYIFDQIGDAYARLHQSGSLWVDEFTMMELTEIMRQKEDGEFAELLCRIRKAKCTEQDIKLLSSRCITDDDPDYPSQSLHVYSRNADVDVQNTKMLNQLTPEDQQVAIRAIDKAKDTHTSLIDVTMPTSKANTGGLIGVLHVAVGAKVMFVVNIDVSDGLVNGALGTVSGLITTENQVTTILVKFSSDRVGAAVIRKSHYRLDYPDSVPIIRHEATFRIGRNKTVEASRAQFPLVLAWATTIHKVQGLTLDQIVVDMTGGRFGAGQAYVAFSRVKSLNSLFIKNFRDRCIKTSSKVDNEMERLTSNPLPQPPQPNILTASAESCLNIGHLNVHSYLAKQEDIFCDSCLQSTHVMCFTETFLKPQHTVHNLTLNNQPVQVFRLDRQQHSTQTVSGGGVMIACVSALIPQEVIVKHSAQLEVKGISIFHEVLGDMCIIAVYKRPQQMTAQLLSLLSTYLECIPYETVPTVILGDFNNNLLLPDHSTVIVRFLENRGFKQIVTQPTTDSGSLLDHIFINFPEASPAVDIVDTYYSDHDGTYLSIPVDKPLLR